MASLRDDDRLRQVQPNDLQLYLLSKGWQLVRALDNKIAIWSERDKDVEIWLPLQHGLADYRRAIADVFETLQQIEDRPYATIPRDLQLVWADILKVRVNPNLIGSDSIKLSEGVTLIERTRDMLLAAARATLLPRAVYSSRPPQVASEYLHQARLGQTEVGSYIITVISPVDREVREETNNIQPVPYTRQVTRTLSESLNAAKEAAQRALETHSMIPFDDAVERGVSANLCEALIGLSHASRDNAVEVQFTWAQRFPESELRPHAVVLPSDNIMTLVAAAQHLREKEPEEDFQTRGTVHRLQDVPEDPGVSIATINGTVDNSPRSIKARLSGENRAAAIRAFDERLEIVANETLDRRTAPYSLLDPITVRLNFADNTDYV